MSDAPRRRRTPTRSGLVRVLLYVVVCWSMIALIWPPSIPGGRWWVALLAILATLPPILFVRGGGWRHYPTAPFRLFVVRPVLYMQAALPLVAGAALLGLLVGAPFRAPLLGGRIAAATVLTLIALLAIVGYIGTRRLVVRRVDATIPSLPTEFDGLRIAQLSDLHIGPQTSRRFLARVVRTTERLAPDLIAVTGDLIDDRVEDVDAFAAGMRGLDAPLGVFLIPGNHDVYAGWQGVAARLAETVPATILVNEGQILSRGGARLALVGTGDPAGRGDGDVAPDIARTLGGVPPGVPVIALAHNPALWPALAERGVALTLSGHTHWGQFALPQLGWSLASLFLARAMGVHESDGALLYIHPGTGYWGIPFRVGARPEVALVTLHTGPTAAIAMSEARPATTAESAARHPRSAPRPAVEPA